jgi:hypothetical protein
MFYRPPYVFDGPEWLRVDMKVSGDFSDIVQSLHIGPMLCQHGPAIVVNLDLADNFDSPGHLRCQVRAAYTATKREHT